MSDTTARPKLTLPADFRWGVSTAAYQIEGAAREDGRGLSIWDTHCLQKGRVANGDTGDVACDHYHRYAEDIALMRDLGIGSYRFSVSWPRVLPRGRGAVNDKGLDFYDRLIDGVLAAGIEPWLCLYHWDLPQALDDLGGWTVRDSAGWFADYATLVARRFGDRVKHFVTFNEPNVCTLFGYALGWNAPAQRDAAMFYRAAHHVNLAHGDAIRALRAHVPDARLGAVHNRQPCHGVSDTAQDQRAGRMLDAVWNRIFCDPQLLGFYPEEVVPGIEPFVQAGDMARIAQPCDFFGLNHYSPIYARHAEDGLGFAWADPPADGPVTGVGWRIHPQAFTQTLIETHARYGLPVYVTENGSGGSDAPDASGAVHDPGRVAYLAAYIAAMQDAIAAGADVRGYFVWSILDNFEWGSGYANRFGLVYVDYTTLARTPKDSFAWYRGLIAAQHD